MAPQATAGDCDPVKTGVQLGANEPLTLGAVSVSGQRLIAQDSQDLVGSGFDLVPGLSRADWLRHPRENQENQE